MKITRRQFVQAMAIAGASALLTACGRFLRQHYRFRRSCCHRRQLQP